ncbi:MAG TPA: hypothetical protein VFG79_07445 [Solirubrobacter sp.]|nr:hypothetical protein [Solirubrobacter sp.]
MTALQGELDACGGAAAPPSALARLREVLAEALRAGRAELAKPRSGLESPVEVALAAHDGTLLAATPVAAALRADADAVAEREWLLAAAVVGTLVELAEPGTTAGPDDLRLRAGELPGGFLVLAYPGDGLDAELLELAFEEQAAGIDRLRARALALPPRVIEDVALREPIGPRHPLRIAETVARLGGRPAGELDDYEDAVLAVLGGDHGPVAPHDDPDPALRAARRILQRLDGMGKWGGYHTEFAHLPRGFAGNDRALAQDVGEALLEAGLLAEKPSVGQRHVYLNPRRAAEIRRLIETGELPAGMSLPSR